MARIALAMSAAAHPAELGPCARPRFLPDQVREALVAAGHQLVDRDPEVRVGDVDGDPPGGGAPLVVTSLGRPVDPWHTIPDPDERQPFIAPWGRDLDRRKRAALHRLADGYADSLVDLVAAIDAALAGPATSGLRYLGAVFNSCVLRPGADLALGDEPRKYMLGRGGGADLLVLSPQLARWHLSLRAVGDGTLELTDLAGTNGTWLRQPDGEVLGLRPAEPVLAGSGALIIPDGSFRFRVA